MSAERETFAREHREVERPAGAARARLLLGFLVLGSVAALEALRAWHTPPLLVGEPDSVLPEWGNAALALAAFLGPVFAPSAPRRWAIALLTLGPLWGVLNVAAGGTNVPWIALVIGLPLVVPPLLRLTRAQVAAALEEDAALRLRRLRQGTPGWVMIYLGCAAPVSVATLGLALFFLVALTESRAGGVALLWLLGPSLRTAEQTFEEAWNQPDADLSLWLPPHGSTSNDQVPRAHIVDRLEVRSDDSVETTRVHWFQLADGRELVTTFRSQGDSSGPWSATWSTREPALLPTFRAYQVAFEGGAWTTLLALVTPELKTVLDSDSAWQVPHEPAHVFSRAPEVESPVLGYFFQRGDDLYQVETRWQATPEGWRLAQLSVERELHPSSAD